MIDQVKTRGGPSSRFGVSIYLNAGVALVFVVAGVCTVLLVNKSMRDEALADAHVMGKLLLDQNLATHTYFTRDLKPKVFELGKLNADSDYFEPSWMSSTHAVRKIRAYASDLDKSKFHYRECPLTPAATPMRLTITRRRSLANSTPTPN